MKNMLQLFALVCIFCFSAVFAQAQGFEGVLKAKFTQNGKAGAVNWTIKDKDLAAKFESEGKSYPFTIYFNVNSDQMVMLNSDGKTAFRIPKDKIPAKNALASNTDQTKVIAGYTCKLINLMEDRFNYQLWVATDLAFDLNAFANFLKIPLPNSAIKGFPLEMKIIDEKGGETYSYITESVKLGSVEASAVKVPEGITIQEWNKGSGVGKKKAE